MEIQTSERQGALIASISGRIDADTSVEFERTLTTLLEEGSRKLVLNLSHLDYISSAGLRSVLSIAKILKSLGGELKLCSATGPVKDVFVLSGFAQMLPWFETEADALK